MSQLDFYLDDSDVERAVDSLLSHDCYLVPDVAYDSPSVLEWELRKLDDFKSFRKSDEAKLFFALSNRVSSAPLELRPIVRVDQTKYFIRQKTGGPTIDLYVPKIIEEHGARLLPSGFIGIHPLFWNTLTSTMEKPSADFKSIYLTACRDIKTKATRARVAKRTYWIGEHTKNQLVRSLKLTSPPIVCSSD
jgi:hypothetical protein